MTSLRKPVSLVMTMSESDARTFPFEKNDYVLIRVREHGTSGSLRAKLVAQCKRIRESGSPAAPSPVATFDVPFGPFNSITMRPYEGEFEVVDGFDQVSF